MSKKKNTLKDLDEFLKQQAATLVSPTPLADQQATSPEKKEIQAADPHHHDQASDEPVSSEKILTHLQQFARKEGPHFRTRLYDLIIKTIEAQNQDTPEDRMLINTALYLKSGDQWKDAIRSYWRKRNNGK